MDNRNNYYHTYNTFNKHKQEKLSSQTIIFKSIPNYEQKKNNRYYYMTYFCTDMYDKSHIYYNVYLCRNDRRYEI